MEPEAPPAGQSGVAALGDGSGGGGGGALSSATQRRLRQLAALEAAGRAGATAGAPPSGGAADAARAQFAKCGDAIAKTDQGKKGKDSRSTARQTKKQNVANEPTELIKLQGEVAGILNGFNYDTDEEFSEPEDIDAIQD